MPDSIASAIFGPTLDTLSRLRNSARSSSVPKPYRMCASSRTTRCVSRRTSLPDRRQRVERRHRRFDVVADAAHVHRQLRRRLARRVCRARIRSREFIQQSSSLRVCAWQMATASASAASAASFSSTRSSCLTMCATWAFSAPPTPTTASLIARGAYSWTPSAAGTARERRAARLPELERAVGVLGEEHALDGDLLRAMQLRSARRPARE